MRVSVDNRDILAAFRVDFLRVDNVILSDVITADKGDNNHNQDDNNKPDFPHFITSFLKISVINTCYRVPADC